MKLKRADKRKRQEEPGSPQRSILQGRVLAQPLPKPEKAAFSVEVPRFFKLVGISCHKIEAI